VDLNPLCSLRSLWFLRSLISNLFPEYSIKNQHSEFINLSRHSRQAMADRLSNQVGGWLKDSQRDAAKTACGETPQQRDPAELVSSNAGGGLGRRWRRGLWV